MARLNTVTGTNAYKVFGTFAGVPFWGGGLTLIAAPPGAGKTSWALEMVTEAAAQGFPAAIGCYEHTEDELASRIHRQAAGRVFGPHPRMDEEAEQRDPRVVRWIAEAGNAVLSSLNGATDTIRIYEDMLLRDEGFPARGEALVVLDYLQRAPVINRVGQLITDDTRAGEAAAALKRIAIRHNWAVVAISALEKQFFTTADLEHLRNNPEQALAALLGDERLPYEADRVFVLYKLETKPCGCCYRLAWLTAKNRLGTTGVREIEFWGQRTLVVPDIGKQEGVEQWQN